MIDLVEFVIYCYVYFFVNMFIEEKRWRKGVVRKMSDGFVGVFGRDHEPSKTYNFYKMCIILWWILVTLTAREGSDGRWFLINIVTNVFLIFDECVDLSAFLNRLILENYVESKWCENKIHVDFWRSFDVFLGILQRFLCKSLKWYNGFTNTHPFLCQCAHSINHHLSE